MVTTIGEYCQVFAGSSAPQDKTVFVSEGIPFVRAGSLEHLCNDGSLDDCEQINKEVGKNLKLRLAPAGTVLFAKSGMSAMKDRVYCLPREAYVVSHLAGLIPSEIVDSRYLAYWFLVNPPSRLINDPAYPSIRLSDISKVKFDPPSLNEQKRIAAIIDKANKIHRNLKLGASLQNELIGNVFLEMFGDPRVNEKNWPTKPLIEVATLQRGFDLPVQNRMPGLVPILASNGLVGYHNEIKVNGPGVVTGRSGSLGHVQFVDEDYWPLNTSLWVKNFHGNEPRWIAHLLRHMNLQNFTRGSGVPTLNRNLVHVVDVIHPPIELQKKFATYEISIQSTFEPIIVSSQISTTLVSSVTQEMLQEMLT